VVQHVSGRVTVTVVDQPDLSVHAASVAAAVEELTLALDDRIARAHPKRLFDLCRPSVAEPLALDVPVLRVRGAEEDERAPLRIHAVHAPAHRPFHEVRAPRLDTRLWFEGKDWRPQTEAVLQRHLEPLDDAALLDLRPEGAESWIDLTIDTAPSPLASLRLSELVLDERPQTRPPEEEEDEGWEDEPRRRKRRPPAKKKRPPAPTLERIAVAWHTLAAEGELDGAYEEDELVARLRARLEVEDPEPLVLVAPAGSGKTALLQELARKLAAEEAMKKKDERDPRPIFYADGPRLIAGQGFHGDWQMQTLEAVREARATKAILILGHVIELLDAGKSAHSEQNLAELLGPVLAAREVPVLGEATPEEWARLERRNAGFARLFTVQRLDEPAPEVVGRILDRVAKERSIAVEPQATAEVQSLCRRFLPYGALVGNAVSLLRRVVDGRAHELAEKVTAADAVARLAAESGIPRQLLDDAQPLDQDEVRAFFAARVKGQEAAVARAAQVVSVIKANLADRQRPTAVLLFAGPTGVGKTELSKALAELLFGSRERLVRLDMGELAGPDALVRLVGDETMPGQLTRAVRRQPFSVVLLDEIEKAHPAVFDALLGVLGEGRLTDFSGHLTDFRSTVVVLTSNLGADTRRERVGFGGGESAAALEAHYRGEAQKFFRPEFYNRLDEIVVFRSLEAAEIRAIVDRELERVSVREGLRRRDVQLQVGDEARRQLVARGLDPRYGARPLKRTIEKLLVAPVAGWLAGHPQSGATRLEVGEELRLSATPLGGGEEGVSRGRIDRVLERAAAVRSEVRRWSRSAPMVRLAQELTLFDRLSRQPSFWHDHELADERARAAAAGRELTAAFADAEKRAEAAEDLAYEAYYARQPAAAETLLAELDLLHGELSLLGERLFASLFPPRNTIALILTCGRTGWPHLCALGTAVDRWVARRGGSCAWWQPLLVEGEAKSKKPLPKPGWHWRRQPPKENDPAPAAIVNVSGTPGLMLLSAEHGAHRFTSGGDTAIVKVRFVPRPPASYDDEDPAELEKTQPGDEIRKLWPQKKLVEDLRLKRRFEMAELDLEPLLAAYLRWRVLERGDEP
jgi:ATP-dependent Clp protease ATP-binding subunit ClpA